MAVTAVVPLFPPLQETLVEEAIVVSNAGCEIEIEDDEEDNVSIISEMDCSIAPSLTRSTTSHRSATTNDEVYIINKNDLIPYNSTSEQSKKDTNYKYKIIK